MITGLLDGLYPENRMQATTPVMQHDGITRTRSYLLKSNPAPSVESEASWKMTGATGFRHISCYRSFNPTVVGAFWGDQRCKSARDSRPFRIMPLEPILPETAVELYLNEKTSELAKASLYSHKSRLGHFVRWCEEQDIDNLNDLTGRNLHRYRLWRRDDGDLSPASEKTQIDTLRVFIRWCESIDAVPVDLSTKIISPSLKNGENVRDVMLDAEVADSILAHLAKYEYASERHVCLTLIWRGLLRRGAVRALDLEDYDIKEMSLEVHHRPDTGTPIKNQQRGERYVALAENTCAVLDAWIADRRPDVDDEYGRKPLLATPQGRPHPTTIQTYVYSITQPCVYTDECPHGRNIQNCEAASVRSSASTCPSSLSPHAGRRGAITHWLASDVPEHAISDRANVSPEIIKKHYDRRSEREKMEQRRRYLDHL